MGAAESGKKQITVTSSGSAVMIVDGVELNISTSVRMPVTYTNDVLQFDAIPPDSYGALGHVVDAGFGCDDIEFTRGSACTRRERAVTNESAGVLRGDLVRGGRAGAG